MFIYVAYDRDGEESRGVWQREEGGPAEGCPYSNLPPSAGEGVRDRRSAPPQILRRGASQNDKAAGASV